MLADEIKYADFIRKSRERFAFNDEQMESLVKYRNGLQHLIDSDPSTYSRLLKKERDTITQLIIEKLDT